MKYNEDTKNIRKDFLKIMEKRWSVALEMCTPSGEKMGVVSS